MTKEINNVVIVLLRLHNEYLKAKMASSKLHIVNKNY